MYLVHEALDHGDGVGAAGLRVDGLLHDDGGDVAELAGELRLPLLAGDLELPFLQNLQKHQRGASSLARGDRGLNGDWEKGMDRYPTSMQIWVRSSVPKALVRSLDLARTPLETLE